MSKDESLIVILKHIADEANYVLSADGFHHDLIGLFTPQQMAKLALENPTDGVLMLTINLANAPMPTANNEDD